jgi:hypothetical protein
MALVRRASAVGRAQVPGIPQQAPAPPVTPGQENAVAVPSRPARGWAVVTGLGIAGLGAVGAWNMHELMSPTVFRMGDTMSTFAALFVFTTAVERVLEPFSRWMPGRADQQRYEQAIADMDNGVPGAMNAAAHYKAAVESARASRGILMWGLATCAAAVLSAGSGFYLLRILAENPTWNGIPPWLDALVTGLVVGSGTKPIHDVITRFQNQAASPQTPF